MIILDKTCHHPFENRTNHPHVSNLKDIKSKILQEEEEDEEEKEGLSLSDRHAFMQRS